MTLGEVIKQYRKDHDLSMADFAALSGMSKAYVSLLEKGMRAGASKPITPSAEVISQSARAMGMSSAALWRLIDDQPLDWGSTISREEHDKEDEALLEGLWKDNQRTLEAYYNRLLKQSYPYKKELDAVLQTMTGAQLRQVLSFAKFLKWEEKQND